MGFIRFNLFVFLLCVSVPSWADNQTCLSYLQIGASSCDQAVSNTAVEEGGVLPPPSIPEEEFVEVERPAPKVKPVVEPAKKQLNERIDDYMEDYGKPPREFVAFNLEPTLENALKWARKYKEMMERNHKLTAAWGQAQTILQEMEGQGLEVPGFEPMAEIPDYGVGLSKGFESFAGDVPSQKNDYAGIAANSNARQGAPTIGFAGNDVNEAITSYNDASVLNKSVEPLFANDDPVTLSSAPEGVVEVSYYFSAECPYCKKFEESFKGLINELGDDLSVTCVDMTPSERKKENIHGKLDCSWRAAIPGEATALGVQSTPTLIVNRKMGAGLEKVEGLVDIGKLKSFLRGEI